MKYWLLGKKEARPYCNHLCSANRSNIRMDGKGFKATHAKLEGVGEAFGTRFYAGSEAFSSVTFCWLIVGLRIAAFIFLGGVSGS